MEANVLLDPLEKPPRISRNNEYTPILHPEKSKALLGVVAHQFSGQTEHLAMDSSGASISARNEPRKRNGPRGIAVYPLGISVRLMVT